MLQPYAVGDAHMASLTPEQRDFVRAAPQVSMELDESHKNVIRAMSDNSLELEQLLQCQLRDFAIAAIAATEEEMQKRAHHGG
jgi:hypothetical protein